MTHHVKIAPIHYEEIASGRKNFEIRFNDRNYKVGDIVALEEYLGQRISPTCPDRYCCDGLKYDERQGDYNPCPLGRQSCFEYTKDIYSGKSIYVKITDIFDISDVMTNYVAFTFKIINIKERK
ncbi:MAG: DUF3850 domain-containing protein [Clostridia bacterium]|nr:DUF3850 domain-containing protein [Clostridia bacterium]